MRRLALPLLMAALPAPALAVEVGVEAFDAMTRVTIPVTSTGEWIVERGEGRIRLRTDNLGGALTAPGETDGRLSGISVFEGRDYTGIEIGFACDCEATHFYGENGIVIVDVTERAPGPADAAPAPVMEAEPVEQTLASPPPAARTWGSSRVEREPPATQGRILYYDRPAPPPAAPLRMQPIPVPAASPPVRVATPGVPAPAPASDEAPVAAPAPRAKPPAPARRIASTSDDAAIDALREVVLEKLALGVEQGRITMNSGADRERESYIPTGCPDEAALDLKRIVGLTGFREGLAPLRVDVYDEMKQINPAAVRMLARHFIAFGLGAEARAVIEAFETDGAPERLILDMAAVLEGERDKPEERLLLKPGCGPRAAVWAAMVAAEARDGTVRERFESAREAVFDVPGPLRKILVARIALGLMDEGDRESAMRLWRNLQTARGPRTPEMRLLAAHAAGDAPLGPLLALSETRSPAAGEAAIRAAGLLLENGTKAQAERLGTTLDDMAFIHRGTPEEAPLSLALARLQARYGDLASALTVLAGKAEEQPERAEYWRGIAHDTIRDAATGADPIARPHDFDTILASLRYLDGTPASDGAKFSLVRKLMNIGGAHIAEVVLTPDLMARSPEARRLMAEAKLLTGDAPAARALLRDLRDADSRALTEQTEARTAKGSAEAARALFETTPRAPAEASIAGARDLMRDAEADLSIIEELLADG